MTVTGRRDARGSAGVRTSAPRDGEPLAGRLAGPSPRLRERMGVLGLGLVVPLLLLGAWSAVSLTGLLSPTLLPAPWRVAEAVWDFFLGSTTVTLPGVLRFDGGGADAVASTVRRWGTAYALAVVVALPLGLAVGLTRLGARLLDPTIQALRAIPIFAWLPLAVVWFGLGEGAARYLVFIGAVFPVLVATADGVARVPRAYVETARMLGTPRAALARRVYLPASLPSVVVGLRLGASLGWMSVIVGELVVADAGVGAVMTAARQTGRLDQVLVGVLCFAVFGLVTDALLRLAARPWVRWSRA